MLILTAINLYFTVNVIFFNDQTALIRDNSDIHSFLTCALYLQIYR